MCNKRIIEFYNIKCDYFHICFEKLCNNAGILFTFKNNFGDGFLEQPSEPSFVALKSI